MPVSVERWEPQSAFYKRVCEITPQPLCCMTAEGRIRWVNESFCTLLGYSGTELLSRKIYEILSPDDVQEVLLAIEQFREEYTLPRHQIAVVFEHRSELQRIPCRLVLDRVPERGEMVAIAVHCVSELPADFQVERMEQRLAALMVDHIRSLGFSDFQKTVNRRLSALETLVDDATKTRRAVGHLRAVLDKWWPVISAIGAGLTGLIGYLMKG